jgi:CubicO group peptidase (beta-lactamase class C family)
MRFRPLTIAAPLALAATLALGACATTPQAAQPPVAQPPVAQPPASLHADRFGARVDSLFARWAQPGSPGAAVAVLRDGDIVLERGYGSAQLEHDAPITPATVFHVASVTKQFTAFAIALLAERGALSLDDDVRMHIPELPDLGRRITLRQLIHHTSGVRDQWELLAMAGWRLDDVITKDHILGLAVRQRALNFEPGAEHLYSNMGYTLLAEVVERVGGRPFPEWMREHVFRPLGMHATHMHDDHERLVPNRAYSYRPAGAAWRNAVLSYANAGATSMFTTAGDLARWLRNYETAQVGSAALTERMRQRAVLAGGDTIPYAFAIVRGEHRGRTIWAHGGADAGFRSAVLHIPAERLGVVVLGNAASVDATGLARQVADIYLGVEASAPPAQAQAQTQAQAQAQAQLQPQPQPQAQPQPSAPAVTVPDSVLHRYAGRWEIDGIGIVHFHLRDGGLVLETDGNTAPMAAESDSTFTVMNNDLRFLRRNGVVDSVVVRGPSGATTQGRRREIVPLTAVELTAYAGTYYSPELEAVYRVERTGDSLTLHHVRHGAIPLEPIDGRTFTGRRWPFNRLVFERDAAGAATGFLLTGSRVRDMRFVRLAADALPR